MQEAVAAAETARVACEAAWAVHAKARGAFHAQMTDAVDAFKELETRRTSELCDGMRRYTIFLSSMLANLQVRLFSVILLSTLRLLDCHYPPLPSLTFPFECFLCLFAVRRAASRC